jgi:hypothetical protein
MAAPRLSTAVEGQLELVGIEPSSQMAALSRAA